MPICITLLKGINVGGHKKIRMEELAVLYRSRGFSKVTTYIQSGNVIFSTEASDMPDILKKIDEAIEKKFGFRVDLVIRTAKEMQQVLKKNPFPSFDETKLHVVFLSAPPENMNSGAAGESTGGKWSLAGRELYLFCPDGFSKFKFPPELSEKKMKVVATARNWNTVNKLFEIAQAL